MSTFHSNNTICKHLHISAQGHNLYLEVCSSLYVGQAQNEKSSMKRKGGLPDKRIVLRLYIDHTAVS